MMEPAEFLSVFLAALAAFAIGWLWYSPLMFGPGWMKEVWGFDMKASKPKPTEKQAAASANMGKLITLAFAFQLFTAYILAHFLFVAGEGALDGNYRDSVTTVLWIWAGFSLPLNFAGLLWEGRSLKHALINASQTLASLIASALVLTALA